ncbi:hypothetical protein J7M00_09560 [bacterium]|nr:hypothetical protein [bacterium]
MGFVKSWIFWIIFALIPFVLTLIFDWSRQTMVYLYFAAIAVAIFIFWIYEKIRPKAQEEF